MDQRSRPRQMSRRVVLIRAGVLTGAAATARLLPGAAALAQDAKGGTLTVAHIGDVDNYDPLTDALDQFQNYGRLLVFGSLTTYDADSDADRRPRHRLGAAMARNWVFTLRDGVTWHDGSPFTADDVKYTFERILDPAGRIVPRAANRRGRRPSRSSTRMTVKINSPRSTPPIPDLMTAVAIVKKDSGEANRDQPVGTGPVQVRELVAERADGLRPQRQLLRSVPAPARLDRLPADARPAGRGHQPHRRQRRARLQPTDPAADGANAWKGRKASSSSSSIPRRSSPTRTWSGKRGRWPTSGCARGWPCASISTAVKDLVYAGTGTPTQQLHGAAHLGLRRHPATMPSTPRRRRRSSPKPDTPTASTRQSTRSRATRT